MRMRLKGTFACCYEPFFFPPLALCFPLSLSFFLSSCSPFKIKQASMLVASIRITYSCTSFSSLASAFTFNCSLPRYPLDSKCNMDCSFTFLPLLFSSSLFLFFLFFSFTRLIWKGKRKRRERGEKQVSERKMPNTHKWKWKLKWEDEKGGRERRSKNKGGEEKKRTKRRPSPWPSCKWARMILGKKEEKNVVPLWMSKE